MRRENLEHIIRAAAEITGDSVIVVFGSQAALVQFQSLPDEMLTSLEADIFPRQHPEKADDIEGAIGQDSSFHHTFGYYADGVGPETALLPPDWEARAVTLQNQNTGKGIGLAPEIHDLAVSKILAGREKDKAWVRAGVDHKIILLSRLIALVQTVKTEPEKVRHALGVLNAWRPLKTSRQRKRESPER